VTAKAVCPEPYDSAGDSQIGIHPAQADPFSLGNVTVVKVRSAGVAVQVEGRGVTGPPSEKLGKNILLGTADQTSVLVTGGPNALPISCLFRAPTTGISRHSEATPRSSQVFGRKEVRPKSASVSKVRQSEAKRVNFGC
jgi:hypothetical protein